MNEIKVPLIPVIDKSKLKSESDKASKIVTNEFEEAGKKSGKNFADGFKGAFSGAAIGTALVAGVQNVIASFGQFQDLAKVQEKAETQLQQAWGGSIDSLKAYASELQGMTIYGDEAILQAQSMLAPFAQNEEQLKQLTKATLDYASATGKDINTAFEEVATSLSGTRNSFKKYGIDLSQAGSQQDKINSLVKQSEILWGGQAEALAKTDFGKIQQGENAIGDYKEEIGKLINQFQAELQPIVFEVLKILTDGFNTVKEPIKTIISIVATIGETIFKSISGAFNTLYEFKSILIGVGTAVAIIEANTIAATVATKAKLVWDKAVMLATKGWTAAQWLLNAALNANPLGIVALAIGGLVAGIIYAWENIDVFRESIKKAWDWITNKLMPILKEAAAFWLKWLNPIGLLITGLGELFDLVKPWIDENFPALGKIIDSVIGYFNVLKNTVSDVWDSFTGLFSSAENSGEKLDENKDKAEKLANANRKLQASVAALIGDIDVQTASLDELQKLQKNIASLNGQSTPQYKEITKRIKELAKEQKELNKQNKASIPTIDDLKKKYISLAEGLEKNQLFEKILNLTKAQNLEKQQLENLNKELEKAQINYSEFAKNVTIAEIASINFKQKGLEPLINEEERQIQTTIGISDAMNLLKQNNISALIDSLNSAQNGYQQLSDEQKKVYDTTLALGNAFSATFQDVLTGQKSFLQGMESLLLDGVQMVLNAMLAEALARSLASADSVATFGVAGMLKFALLSALINSGVGALKAKIGAEEGTDFSKPLTEHRGKVGNKDTILMAITPKEAQYGILSDKALDKGGRLATNRELAQIMNKGESVEEYLLKKFQINNMVDNSQMQNRDNLKINNKYRTFNKSISEIKNNEIHQIKTAPLSNIISTNTQINQIQTKEIILQQIETNRKLAEIKEIQRDLVKKQKSIHHFEFKNLPKETKVKEIELWRY